MNEKKTKWRQWIAYKVQYIDDYLITCYTVHTWKAIPRTSATNRTTKIKRKNKKIKWYEKRSKQEDRRNGNQLVCDVCIYVCVLYFSTNLLK